MTQATQPKKDTSPRAGGPAGPQFEAKVATHYALAVLAQTEAFGLPCAIVDRLEFQRSGLGHPLDDIIIKATTRAGEHCCLEVQAKRSMALKAIAILQPSSRASSRAAKKVATDALPLLSSVHLGPSKAASKRFLSCRGTRRTHNPS
jgi:hypothetical protein